MMISLGDGSQRKCNIPSSGLLNHHLSTDGSLNHQETIKAQEMGEQLISFIACQSDVNHNTNTYWWSMSSMISKAAISP